MLITRQVHRTKRAPLAIQIVSFSKVPTASQSSMLTKKTSRQSPSAGPATIGSNYFVRVHASCSAQQKGAASYFTPPPLTPGSEARAAPKPQHLKSLRPVSSPSKASNLKAAFRKSKSDFDVEDEADEVELQKTFALWRKEHRVGRECHGLIANFDVEEDELEMQKVLELCRSA
jgi:hypothetical protein